MRFAKLNKNDTNYEILIINTSSNPDLTFFVDKIKRTLDTYKISSLSSHYRSLDDIDIQSFKSIIISPTTIGEETQNPQEVRKNWVEKLKYFSALKNNIIPTLGICGGHLLLGLLFGAEIISRKEREVGDNLPIEIIKPSDAFFHDINTTELIVKQNHNNSITLPQEFSLLGTSKICKVQIMKHKEKLYYSTQFHVEENPILFTNFLRISKLI